MSIIQPTRRSFLTGLTAAFAAPAIVRAASLMPVKSMPPADVLDLLKARVDAAYALTRAHIEAALYGTGTVQTYPGGLSAFVPQEDIFAHVERDIPVHIVGRLT